ncbi:MAG: type II toxin-antitoxin system VapC family toxin [Methylococcales bacterium]|nr:type II toxin-antitoxin system VapC family toxin [Methylococcales bacterium]MDP3839467.1 type II toxin-antitoxin system VapC family toxin [Methylococcales bacterium]
MKYLLDTNTCIAFLKGNQTVVEKIRLVGIENLLLCSVVKAELWFGACKSERVTANQAVLKEFFMQFSSISFDDNAIEHYGDIRALLSKVGKPIGANDFLIAAIARANQLTLITNNTREFVRVPDLLLEDWLH